jgi:hypothetical protein
MCGHGSEQRHDGGEQDGGRAMHPSMVDRDRRSDMICL